MKEDGFLKLCVNKESILGFSSALENLIYYSL